jgi:hypothetical protein
MTAVGADGQPAELPQSRLIVQVQVNNFFWLTVARRRLDYDPAIAGSKNGYRGNFISRFRGRGRRCHRQGL